jgi:hypothetical protein
MKNYISKAQEPDRIIPRNGAIDKPTDLLNQLLARGDKVSIEGGKLVVVPTSGKSVPSNWFDANESEIVEQIAVQTGVIILRYAEYSTGVYSEGSYPGVTLQFDCVTTSEGDTHRRLRDLKLHPDASQNHQARHSREPPTKGAFQVKPKASVDHIPEAVRYSASKLIRGL